MKLFRIAASVRHAGGATNVADFKKELTEELRRDLSSRKRPSDWINSHLWIQDVFKKATDPGTRAEVKKLADSITKLLQDSGWHKIIEQDPDVRGLEVKRRIWGPVYDRKPGAPKVFGAEWFKLEMPKAVDEIGEAIESMVGESEFPRRSLEPPMKALLRIMRTPTHVVKKEGVERFLSRNWKESIGNLPLHQFLTLEVKIYDTLTNVRRDVDAFARSLDTSDIAREDVIELQHDLSEIVAIMGFKEAFLADFIETYKGGPVERTPELASIASRLAGTPKLREFARILAPLAELPRMHRELDKLGRDVVHTVEMAEATHG